MQNLMLENPPARIGAKRPNPRGVFEKEPGSGAWWIRYVDADGRLRREKAGTKSAAINLVHKRKTESLQGKKLPETLRRARPTFGELLDDALAYSKREKRSYREDVWMEKNLREWVGAREADSVKPHEIQAKLEQAMDEKGWSASTFNHHRSLLSLTYRLANQKETVTTNPARNVPRRHEDNGRVRWLTPAEEERLRKVLQTSYPEHVPELDLAMHTGLRSANMYALDWERVNLPIRMLTIPSINHKNKKIHHVPLNAVAVAALEAYRARSDGSGRVIRDSHGHAMSPQHRWFNKATRKAGIKNFRWHDLRHTFGSRLVMNRVDLYTVSKLMGHSNIAMTQRYAHLAPDYLRDAVESLAEPTDTTTDTGPMARPQPQSWHVN